MAKPKNALATSTEKWSKKLAPQTSEIQKDKAKPQTKTRVGSAAVGNEAEKR